MRGSEHRTVLAARCICRGNARGHRQRRDRPRPALQAQCRRRRLVDRHRLAVAVPGRASLRDHGHQPRQAARPAAARPAPAAHRRRGEGPGGPRRSADAAGIRDPPADRVARRARPSDRVPARRPWAGGGGGSRGGSSGGAGTAGADTPPHRVRDRHFRREGRIVGQLTEAFADDWLFTTGEKLLTGHWSPPLEKAGTVPARVVTSGPDEDMEQIEFVALHAISCANKSVRVVTPYFLPPEPLTMSLGLAALRGVTVDIVLPEHSNHPVVDWARRIPLRPLIEAGCRVWMRPAPFDHSKLMVIDDSWTLIGSANWDTRSFRLNFELNVELHDPDFACTVGAVAPTTRQLTLAELDSDPLPIRLRNSAARLLQPYL